MQQQTAACSLQIMCTEADRCSLQGLGNLLEAVWQAYHV
jgi:hypothetical protein